MQVAILVIDDSITIQKVIRIALAHLPYLVHLAANLGEASDLISRIDFGLILADANIIDAKSPIDYAKLSQAADCPLVLLVGSFETVDERAFADVGLREIVRKPFEVGDIVSVCKKFLEGKYNPPPPPVKKDQPLPKQTPVASSYNEASLNPATTNAVPPAPPPPMRPAFSGLEGTGSFTMSQLNVELSQLRKHESEVKKPRKAYPDDDGVAVSAESSVLKDSSHRMHDVDVKTSLDGTDTTPIRADISEEVLAYLDDRLPDIIEQSVMMYCKEHFAGVAELILREELRRLADDKTKLLSSDD